MYLDVYFLINLMIDRCALGAALRQYPLAGWRLWLSAALGALGACLWEVSALPGWMRPGVVLALSGFMLYACIGRRPGRQWRKAWMELYLYAFLFAGVIPVVSRYMPLWIGSVLISYAGIRFWVKQQTRKEERKKKLKIEAQGKCWQVDAIVDTGHQLKDPATGRPVIILQASATPKGIQAGWPISYQTVQGAGMIFAFWPQRLWIEDRMYKEDEILVAMAKDWKASGCQALIPGYMME